MAFITSHLTSKEEKKDLEKIFKAMDRDGNGMLDKEEILAGYEEHFGIPISEETVDAMFKAVDIDGNGSIDYTEFVMATMSEKDLVTNDRLRAAFRLFDKDGSGSISSAELKASLGIGDKDNENLNKLLKEIDENGDGEI
jgi:calcium-dependent protein kinase